MDMPLDALNDVPDEALLVAYGNGDREAAMVLTMRFTPWILGYATRFLHDAAEAEDVAQEAMLRLWKVAPDWRQGEAKVTTWLYRVVANLCKDRLRKRRNVSLDSVAEPVDGAASVEEKLIERDRLLALQSALATLPDRQREAVVLRHIEGLGNPEIAEIMGLSVEAIESLTARGKRALGHELAGRRKELGYD